MPFSSLKLHPALLKAIRELGFARPTPIQAEAIPPAMAGRDVLACAQTGSGKTAAFLLPIIHQLIDRPRRTTRALVLTPTRELAAQIVEDLNALAVHTPVTGAAVYGGVGMGPQEHAFRSGVDVIVATPGRLLDHFRSPYAKLDGVEYLVLDEADRMLDMGFLPDIRRVLRHIPVRRQTLLFSATMPPPIAKLASEMLKNPVQINMQRQAAPAVGIAQAVYPVPQDLKGPLLVELLERGILKEALVFTRTKHRANRLADLLVRHRLNAARIHGNRSQAQRTEALAGFKSGKYRVLVATDIAARGIDVEALSHVVNFDVPAVPEDYIHRVGRTGRAELTGDAFTFVAPDEEERSEGDRTRNREIAAARHAARFRLSRQAAGQARDSDGRAHRGDPLRARPRSAPARKAKAQRRTGQPRPAPSHPRTAPPSHPRTDAASPLRAASDLVRTPAGAVPDINFCGRARFALCRYATCGTRDALWSTRGVVQLIRRIVMLQRCAAVLAAAIMTVACAQTDAGITTNVKTKLAADDTVKAYQVDVDTRNGVVTLSGDVESAAAKEQAIQIARQTDGVRDVIDQIRVGEAAATAGRDNDVDVDVDVGR